MLRCDRAEASGFLHRDGLRAADCGSDVKTAHQQAADWRVLRCRGLALRDHFVDQGVEGDDVTWTLRNSRWGR